jgi:predicted alpha/beta hydrolase family esterase
MTAARVLLIPGLWNSGPENWQSYWEREYGFESVLQRDWDTPDRGEWVETLQRTISASAQPIVLVGHSLGCSLIVHWAAVHGAEKSGSLVRGALLVAPSDTEAPSYPDCTTGFVPMPLNRLPFPSIVAASSDDAYVSLVRAQTFAHAWGSTLEIVGAHGHINADSRLGVWQQGSGLLQRLLG